MGNRIDKIFDECINRINSGESIESCLQRYPEEAQQLSVLLQTYVNVRWRSSTVRPTQDFKARARLNLLYEQRMEAQQHYRRQPEKHRQPSFSFGRIWAPALAGMIVFVLVGSAGTAAAATGAMPDEPLYTVKLATEQVQLALTFSQTDKAIINTQQAEKRSEEIQVMALQGKIEEVVNTTTRMVQSLEKAETAINKLSETWAYTSGPEPVTPVTPAAPVPPTKTTQAPTAAVKTTPSTGTSPSVAITTRTPTTPAATENASQVKKTQVTTLNEKTEKLWQSVNSSLNKNVNALESALKKAPESTREAIQKAIDIAKSKRDSFNSTKLDYRRDSNNDRNTSNRSNGGSTGTPTPSTSDNSTGNKSNTGTNSWNPPTTIPSNQPGTLRTTPAPTTTPSTQGSTRSNSGFQVTTDNSSGNIDVKSRTSSK